MNVVLVMFRENGERRSFSLSRDVTVVGRREDADFRIPLTDVSRKHCRLIKDGNVLLLEDLGSSNGTYHNDRRVQEAEVQPGDRVRIGPVEFIIQIDGVPADHDLGGTVSPASGSGLVDSSATLVTPTPFMAMPPSPPREFAPSAPSPVLPEMNQSTIDDPPDAIDEFAIVLDDGPAAVEDDYIEIEAVSDAELVAEEPEDVSEEAAAEPALEPADALAEPAGEEAVEETEPLAELFAAASPEPQGDPEEHQILDDEPAEVAMPEQVLSPTRPLTPQIPAPMEPKEEEEEEAPEMPLEFASGEFEVMHDSVVDDEDVLIDFDLPEDPPKK